MIPSLRVSAIIVVALSIGVWPSIGLSTSEADIALIEKNGPRMAAIISSVASPNGHVDKETHQEFWALLPESIRANPQSFVENLEIVRSMMYQKELWESIRLSARAGSIVKTLGYGAALAQVHGSDAAGQDAARRADQMLAAAATGKPLQGRKETQVLTEELANQVLDELNSSTARLWLLLDPVWLDHGTNSQSALKSRQEI